MSKSRKETSLALIVVAVGPPACGDSWSFMAINSNIRRKLRERANAKDPADPFIEREGYPANIDRAEKQFREQLVKLQRR